MSLPDHPTAPTTDSPEGQARREIGRTEVRPRVARALLAGGLLVLLAPPAVHLGAGDAGDAWARFFAPLPELDGARDLQALSRQRIETVEGALEESSPVGEVARPPIHRLLAASRIGSSRVAVGREGWLYLRSGLDHLTGPPFLQDATRRFAGPATSANERQERVRDPRPALRALAEDLRAHGVELLVLLVPTKAAVVPGPLAPDAQAPLANPSLPGLLADLEADGITVHDATEDLLPLAETAFLRTDSHWSPEGVEAVAAALAGRVAPLLGPSAESGSDATEGRVEAVAATGDLARLLDLEVTEQVRLRLAEVEPPLARPGEGEVLLLGDSFSNVFSEGRLGWGEHAGLAERLGAHLGRPVEKLAVDDGGDLEARQALARALRADPRRLAATRLVIQQIAQRELSVGHWPVRRLPEPESPPPAATGPAPDRARVEVLAVASPPGGAASPYRDALVAVRLRVVGAPPGEEILGYGRFRIDGRPGPFADLEVGRTLEVELVPWTDATDAETSLQRHELDDDSFLLDPYLLRPLDLPPP